MNLGFYFHEPFVADGSGAAKVPPSLGVLVDALACEAGHVTFYAHRTEHPAGTEDFVLSEPSVTTVDLGGLRSFPARTFTPWRDLAAFRPREAGLDAMFVMGATPLLPYLARRAGDVPVFFMLWADYATWRPQPHFPWWRNLAIRGWTRLYALQQKVATRNRPVFVQEPGLRSVVSRSASVTDVMMPSLTASAMAELRALPVREPKREITLLYAGRIVREKGLFEVVTSLHALAQRGIEATFALAGVEAPNSGIVAALRSHADGLGVAERVRFLGHLSGQRLLDAYATADVFVYPSYWEGFPRSVHEAMASALPVVATSVGGMQRLLADDDTALLVPPRDAAAVTEAIARLATDAAVRRRIALSGRAWAEDTTVESSARRIVDAIRERIA